VYHHDAPEGSLWNPIPIPDDHEDDRDTPSRMFCDDDDVIMDMEVLRVIPAPPPVVTVAERVKLNKRAKK
jgi:hypothetical protein